MVDIEIQSKYIAQKVYRNKAPGIKTYV